MARRRSFTPKVCEDCYGTYYNLHAHLEECPGPMEWTGRWACDRCDFGQTVGGACRRCGWSRTSPLRRKRGSAA